MKKQPVKVFPKENESSDDRTGNEPGARVPHRRSGPSIAASRRCLTTEWKSSQTILTKFDFSAVVIKTRGKA